MIVAVASAVLQVIKNLGYQFVLPTKDKLIQTAAIPKQLDKKIQPITIAQNFKNLQVFRSFIRQDSGSNEHERINLSVDPKTPIVLEISSFWLADGTFKNTLRPFISYIQFMLVRLALHQQANSSYKNRKNLVSHFAGVS